MSRCAYMTRQWVGKPAWVRRATTAVLLTAVPWVSAAARPGSPQTAGYRSGEMLLMVSPDADRNGVVDRGE